MSPRSVCGQCAGIINHRTSKAVTCVKCDLNYHRDCAKLTVKRYEEILEKSLRWMCMTCNKERLEKGTDANEESKLVENDDSKNALMNLLADMVKKLDAIMLNQNLLSDEITEIKTSMAELRRTIIDNNHITLPTTIKSLTREASPVREVIIQPKESNIGGLPLVNPYINLQSIVNNDCNDSNESDSADFVDLRKRFHDLLDVQFSLNADHMLHPVPNISIQTSVGNLNNDNNEIGARNATVLKSLHLLGKNVELNSLNKHFHISPFDVSVTAHSIMKYIAENCKMDKDQIRIRRLTKKGQDITALKHVNFKIETSAEISNIISQQSFWPHHIKVKPWVYKTTATRSQPSTHFL